MDRSERVWLGDGAVANAWVARPWPAFLGGVVGIPIGFVLAIALNATGDVPGLLCLMLLPLTAVVLGAVTSIPSIVWIVRRAAWLEGTELVVRGLSQRIAVGRLGTNPFES